MSAHNAPHGWDGDAHRLWINGERIAALQVVIKHLNRDIGRESHRLVYQFSFYAFNIGDMNSALKGIDRAIELGARDPEVFKNRAVILSRLGNFKESYEVYRDLIAADPANAQICDGMCYVLYELGRTAEAAEFGKRAIEIKSSEVGIVKQDLEVIDGKISKNIVSFCVWGTNKRYLYGLLRNALVMPDIYPGWTMRLYHDASVPADYIQALSELDVECVEMPADDPINVKLMWRFLVASDRSCGKFLVRDADAVINIREAAAVAEWTASGKPFHVMRDWWTHTDLILAGMWGGTPGLLPTMRDLFDDHAPSHMTANSDQGFLGRHVWPRIAHHSLIHDRFFRTAGSIPFPDVPLRTEHAHVGQNEYAAEPELQKRILRPWIRSVRSLGDPDRS